MLLTIVFYALYIRKLETLKQQFIKSYFVLLPLCAVIGVPISISIKSTGNTQLDYWGVIGDNPLLLGADILISYLINVVAVTVLILIGAAIAKFKRKLPN